MSLMRADKLLASAGVGTRSEVKKIIRSGRLKRNDIPVKTPEEKLDPETMNLTLDGAPFGFADKEYWVLNKPAGVLSATEDKRHETVISYMGLQRKGLAPCGRLDIDTEGLLLITDDGALVHKLLAPSKKVPKQYEVRYSGVLPSDAADRIAKGMELADGTRFLPGKLDSAENPALLTIVEGKFHEVKRMFAALGCPVEKLRRLSMGPLCLSELNLGPGEFRKLSVEEQRCLLAYAEQGSASAPFSFADYDAVIFDLDGTLADSMGHWAEIDRIYLERFGIEAPENLSQVLGGRGIGEVADYFKEVFGIPDSKEQMLRDWEELSIERYANDTALKPGVLPFLAELKRRRIKMAIATSNARPMVDAVLEAHGIDRYFDVIVSGTDVEKGKPHPEIYLKAAAKSGVIPERCAVFEDLPEGIQAGLSAGMRVYAVEDEFSASYREEKAQLAFAMIKDYRELWQTKEETR